MLYLVCMYHAYVLTSTLIKRRPDNSSTCIGWLRVLLVSAAFFFSFFFFLSSSTAASSAAVQRRNSNTSSHDRAGVDQQQMLKTYARCHGVYHECEMINMARPKINRTRGNTASPTALVQNYVVYEVQYDVCMNMYTGVRVQAIPTYY